LNKKAPLVTQYILPNPKAEKCNEMLMINK